MMAFRIVVADQHEVEWAPDLWGYSTDLGHCKDRMIAGVESLKRRLNADKVYLVFSGAHNFRKDLNPKYKANRSKPKPVGYKAFVDWCRTSAEENGWNFAQIPYLEADDLMGYMGSDPAHPERIIVSGDKDMRTIPCRLVGLNDPKLEEITITPEEADWNWMFQSLIGDPTDGFPGCPGVGKVTGKKMLDALVEGEETWGMIREAYVKAHKKNALATIEEAEEDVTSPTLSEEAREGFIRHFGTEEAIMNARMARIFRFEDYEPGKGWRLFSPGSPTADYVKEDGNNVPL